MMSEQPATASEFVEQPKDDNSNIDSALLEQQSNNSIFISNEGAPFVFYIADTESDKAELTSLIEQHGGSVCTNPNDGLYISSYGDANRDVFKTDFIRDSVKQKAFLNKEKYRVYLQYDNQNNKASGSGKSGLQPLVDYIQQDEGTYTAAAAAAASTANKQQKLASTEIDQSFLPIANRAAPLENIPTSFPSITRRSNSSNAAANKNGFTDEEDEFILEYVRNNPSRRSTHKLFQEIAEKMNKHTGNSVRYRFRCMLSQRLDYVYVFDSNGNIVKDENGQPKRTTDLPGTMKKKFTADDDYLLCSAVRAALNDRLSAEDKAAGVELPQDPHSIELPGKFFDYLSADHKHHSRAAWRDRFRKFAIPYGIDKYISYYNECKAKNETPVEIKNFTGNNLFKTTKKFLNGDYDPNNEEESRPAKRQRKNKAQAQLDKQTDSNIFINADSESYTGYSTQNQTTETAVANALNAAQQHQYYPHLTLEQAGFLTPELVSEKFLQFNPILSVVDKVKEIVSRDFTATDADELVETFRREVGIEPKFSGLIITQVCGELLFIPTYIEKFLRTGENPPNNIQGIWTSEHDQMLRGGKPEDLEFLRQLHGEHRMQTRRSILNDNQDDGEGI